MRVYSDTLTADDLHNAARRARVGIRDIAGMQRPRVRARGWVLSLTGSSTRHRNSGTYGADHDDFPPATWDEHGAWMAALYEVDPDARIAYYRNREDFHTLTANAYRA